MRPIRLVTSLKALTNYSPSTFTRGGVILSDHDNQTVTEVFEQWLLLLTDLGYLAPETFKRDATRLWKDISNHDVLHSLNVFSELAHQVRLGRSTRFKALCTSISCHLYGLIRKDVTSVNSGDVLAAKKLLQVFTYCNRLTLRDIDLTQECLDSYCQVEDQMVEEFPIGLTRSLNKIVKRWFRNIEVDKLPKHGPGGVAAHGRTSLDVKYLDLSWDDLLLYAFPTAPDYLIDKPQKSTMDRISQTIFVPKSYKTFRTISMESSTTQFYQQSVWKTIDNHVSRSRYLRSRIGFHEQERNQVLAREGSLERNYATIDLSSASDSVSYELVKRLFRGTPLLRFLIATRSPRTLLPDGRLLTLKKFAPMGSATCFPIETIIFAAVCQLVTWEHGVTGDFSVFGDDIIVPTQCVDDVIYYLTLLGFYVNVSKSFTDPTCWFRESCGGEYVDGYDITPMMVSRQYAANHDDVGLTSLIDLANRAGEKNFLFLRSYFINKLMKFSLKNGRPFIPHFSPTSLVSASYSNFHTQRRWNSNLHRIDVRVTTVSTKNGERDDRCAYQHWLLSTSQREELLDAFVANTGQSTVSLRDGYIGKAYESNDDDFIQFFRDSMIQDIKLPIS